MVSNLPFCRLTITFPGTVRPFTVVSPFRPRISIRSDRSRRPSTISPWPPLEIVMRPLACTSSSGARADSPDAEATVTDSTFC